MLDIITMGSNIHIGQSTELFEKVSHQVLSQLVQNTDTWQ